MSNVLADAEKAVSKPYHCQTISQTFERIQQGTTPWVAIGDFLDDWKRSAPENWSALVVEPIANHGGDADLRRWAAFCAAMVEWMCWKERLPFPSWTARDVYLLPEPWFLYRGWRLRAWQLATTPAPFKVRNIFGGDRMLDRV